MFFTGLKSMPREWLKILLDFKWESLWTDGWAHNIKWETSKEQKMQSAWYLMHSSVVSACSIGFPDPLLSMLMAFITLTVGFYLLLFMWDSESFLERTALILASVQRGRALLWTESGQGPVGAASLHRRCEQKPKAESSPSDYPFAVPPIRLSLNF